MEGSKTIILALLLSIMPCIMQAYTNYFTPGTEWVKETMIPTKGIFKTYYKAEYNTVIDGRDCLVIKLSGDQIINDSIIINVDGNKIWVLNENQENSTNSWELLYDFGLKPESSVEVALHLKPNVRYQTVTYVEEGMCTDNPDIPYMLVAVEPPTDMILVPEPNIMTWLPGIGSTFGPFVNAIGYEMGYYGSRLVQVKHNETIVYSAESMATESIDVSQNSEDIIYDLYGNRVKTIIPGNIYIKNGTKIISK